MLHHKSIVIWILFFFFLSNSIKSSIISYFTRYLFHFIPNRLEAKREREKNYGINWNSRIAQKVKKSKTAIAQQHCRLCTILSLLAMLSEHQIENSCSYRNRQMDIQFDFILSSHQVLPSVLYPIEYVKSREEKRYFSSFFFGTVLLYYVYARYY